MSIAQLAQATFQQRLLAGLVVVPVAFGPGWRLHASTTLASRARFAAGASLLSITITIGIVP